MGPGRPLVAEVLPGFADNGDGTTVAIIELEPGDVYAATGTRVSGLSAAEVAQRAARAGPNTLPPPPPRRLWSRVVANFGHVMAILLWVGGAIAFAGGLPQLGIAIWTVNLINGVFSYWQEHKAEEATAALQRLLPSMVNVVRSGVVTRIDAVGVVPGDVVMIEEGDRISADGRLVEHVSLRVDQSTLTGESAPVRKSADAVAPPGRPAPDSPNMVYAGTTVSTGRGRVVVTAIGSGTEFGRVARLTQGMGEVPSPLQVEMRRLSVTVSMVAVGAGAVFFLLAATVAGMSPLGGFVLALGMIVAFVPEGLLPTVTLTLAMATQRMARRNALVKRLSSVETLGCTTVICTDKTGTLTQNEMTVQAVWTTAGTTYELAGVGYEPVGNLTPAADGDLLEVLRVGHLACNARLSPPSEPGGRWSVVGDPTEGAVCVAAAKAGIDLGAAAVTFPRLVEFAFDSRRKRMSAVVRDGIALRLMVKGAPNELVRLCDRQATPSGVAPLGEAGIRTILDATDRFAASGLRVLGVARRTLDTLPEGIDPAPVERDLEFLGLVAMHDPPRPEVAAAVATSRRAGIRFIMITGDHGVTAEVIGRRVGIIGPERPRIVTGEELDRIGDAELRDVLAGPAIFSRVSPEHKLKVVTVLQGMGEVVAVTGDGVNDAPALKQADIGVAMGLTGSDVAKEAADVVLLDDNLASVVAAVEEGRSVYDNIKKFTTYILTSNTPEAVPFVASALSGGVIPIALGVMHILAVDLGTDLAPALALGAEPPEPGLMDRPPRRRSARLIDRHLLVRAYLWLGLAQATFVMAAFFAAYWLMGWPGWSDLPSEGTVYRAATAMALAAVVATQIGNLFAQRSATVPLHRIGLGGNRGLWWGVASEIAVILAIVYLPWLQNTIGTAPFPAVGWLWLLLGVPLLPAMDGIRKLMQRRGSERSQ